MVARLVLLAMTGGVVVSGAALENGNFEQNHEGDPAGWKVLGPGVSVKPAAGTVWNRGQMVFNSGAYKRVRIWLGMEGGAGSVWFDNVRMEESEFSTQIIANPSFEEGESDVIKGWMQEPANGSSRDTTRWERFPGQAEGKGASARVTSPDGTRSRIGQDVRIHGRNEPNREFVLSFDWRAEAPDAHLVTEVYGIEADGQVGPLLPVTPLEARFPQEKFGKNILSLSLGAPGETGVSQPLELSADERKLPWRVSVLVRVAKLNKGSVVLSVQTGAEAGSEARTEISRAGDVWQEVS